METTLGQLRCSGTYFEDSRGSEIALHRFDVVQRRAENAGQGHETFGLGGFVVQLAEALTCEAKAALRFFVSSQPIVCGPLILQTARGPYRVACCEVQLLRSPKRRRGRGIVLRFETIDTLGVVSTGAVDEVLPRGAVGAVTRHDMDRPRREPSRRPFPVGDRCGGWRAGLPALSLWCEGMGCGVKERSGKWLVWCVWVWVG